MLFRSIAEAVRRLSIRAMLGASYLDTSWEAFADDVERMIDTSLDTAISLKKGDFTTPPVDPIFQKENGGLKYDISKPPFCAARPNKPVLL